MTEVQESKSRSPLCHWYLTVQTLGLSAPGSGISGPVCSAVLRVGKGEYQLVQSMPTWAACGLRAFRLERQVNGQHDQPLQRPEVVQFGAG